MSYDVHILLACLVGVGFSAMLLAAAGRSETSVQEQPRVHRLPNHGQRSSRRAA